MATDTQQENKDEPTGSYDPTNEESELIDKWKRRFKKAERYREPHEDKWLRMWKLYRSYRRQANYAYNTNIMPPIGFEIIETIKPRLASSKMRTRMFPTKEEDVGNESLEKWDDLVNYNFQEMDLDDKKMDWIHAMLNFGNGYLHPYWVDAEDGGDPDVDVLDNWLFYFDPTAGPRLKDSGWEIKQVFKKKEKIKKTEENRGEGNEIYKNLEYVENETISDDPRTERYEIDTLKASQIDSGERDINDTQSSQTDEKSKIEQVELWECHDHYSDKIITIANRKVIIREEENPYKDINDGRMFVDLPCIKMPWSNYAMAILEPVETTIHEIADSRNQAMDDIVFSLDPIRKVNKNADINEDDLKYEPGALWKLNNTDDVVTERGPEISRSWIDKDEVLRNEIQSSLALSEYVRGMPQSSQEPMGKVELLLMQSNIRFSQFVRQLEIAMTELAEILIGMNKEFLPEKKTMRLVGEDVNFEDFTADDKEVNVDARVEIDVKQDKTTEQRKGEAKELYEMFVVNDRPDPKNEEAMKAWKQKKRTLEQLILEEYGKEEYEEALIRAERSQEKAEQPGDQPPEEEQPPQQGGGSPQKVVESGGNIPQPVEKIQPEQLPQGMAPATNSLGSEPSPGLMRRLLARVNQAKQAVLPNQ